MSRAPNDRGFSLVEALVALGVFAMAGVALVQLQSHSLSTFARVETSALADLAAQNRLTEIVSGREIPRIGAREENIQFAGRDWHMVVTVAATPQPRTRLISIVVGQSGASAPPAVAHGFINAPENAP